MPSTCFLCELQSDEGFVHVGRTVGPLPDSMCVWGRAWQSAVSFLWVDVCHRHQWPASWVPCWTRERESIRPGTQVSTLLAPHTPFSSHRDPYTYDAMGGSPPARGWRGFPGATPQPQKSCPSRPSSLKETLVKTTPTASFPLSFPPPSATISRHSFPPFPFKLDNQRKISLDFCFSPNKEQGHS